MEDRAKTSIYKNTNPFSRSEGGVPIDVKVGREERFIIDFEEE